MLLLNASVMPVTGEWRSTVPITLLSEFKGYHGARIEFYDCEYDKELLEKTRIKELGKTEKREKTIAKNKADKKVKKK
jgi:hypothetical protein